MTSPQDLPRRILGTTTEAATVIPLRPPAQVNPTGCALSASNSAQSPALVRTKPAHQAPAKEQACTVTPTVPMSAPIEISVAIESRPQDLETERQLLTGVVRSFEAEGLSVSPSEPQRRMGGGGGPPIPVETWIYILLPAAGAAAQSAARALIHGILSAVGHDVWEKVKRSYRSPDPRKTWTLHRGVRLKGGQVHGKET